MQPFYKGSLLPFLVLFFGMWVNSAAAQDCKPEITTPEGTALCNGASVLLQSSAAATYSWSTGATTPSIKVTAPGTYWVKTTTADGCVSTSESITIAGAPDASITDPDYNFTYCSYSGSSASFNLVAENTSTTKETNKSYTINWGDGQTNTYGKDFEKAAHTYKTAGSFDLVLTVTGDNGCQTTKTQRVFIGSNPGLGISSEGNNTQCAPATYEFKITGVEGNSPHTVYTFQFDDGTPAITYKHSELPADRIIRHTFTESSKNTDYGFTLTGMAQNPCSSSRATFSGIRISKGPEADFGLGSNALCINPGERVVDIDRQAFAGSSGVVQLNQSAGVGNRMANSVSIRVMD